MTRSSYPTITQANMTYFIMAVLLLVSSIILIPILGPGTNLWINEYVYILLPALLMSRINGWKPEDTYRYKRISSKNAVISILSGISAWFFISPVAKLIDILLNESVGIIKTKGFTNISISQGLLLLLGMVILAPICEETLFRGLIQKAYESHSSKHGFIYAGVLFGIFHIFNGVKDVLPAIVLGLVFGYVAYKTGSIAGSMLAHAANNFCALVFGSLISSYIPSWFIFAGIISLIALILLLRGLKTVTVHNEGTPADEPTGQKFTKQAVIFLILSLILVLSAGVLEILARAGIFG